MKNKQAFIYLILVLSIVINILLCVHIAEPDSKYEPVYEDEIERDKNLIPDEQTAKRVADIIVVTQENIDVDEYEITVTFDEKKYEWVVYYRPRELMFDGGIKINIRRDNGKIHIYELV